MVPQKQEEYPSVQVICSEIGPRKSITFAPQPLNAPDVLATFRLPACGLPQALSTPFQHSAEIKEISKVSTTSNENYKPREIDTSQPETSSVSINEPVVVTTEADHACTSITSMQPELQTKYTKPYNIDVLPKV